jgi:hypothetical protein
MKQAQVGIEEMLGRVFDEMRTIKNRKEHAKQRHEFVFHMTDWKDDVEKLIKLYAEPATNAEARGIVVEFLYHAIPHLNAAGRLLLERVPDPFATKPNQDGPEK